MYKISNFTDNDNIKVLNEMGAFKVIEYVKDLSVTPSNCTSKLLQQSNER